MSFRPVARAASVGSAEPIAPPKLEPLAAAKLAWQPTLRWCKKELQAARWTDPKVHAAVEQFHTLIQATVAAPDAGQFLEAQTRAAGYVREHQFLRWSPLPSPLPSL